MKDGWSIKPLGEICEIKPSKAEARARLEEDDEVSFAPMEDLGTEAKFLNAQKIRHLSEVAGSYTYFADGDVLLAKITPCFENGKLGIARGLRNGIGFGSSEFVVLRPTADLDAEFLYYYLSRPLFREEGVRNMSGAVGHKRVSKDFIESYPVPVPPLNEQRRIVAILDEAFEAIATAKANTEKNLQSERELFDGHMERIFSAPPGEWLRQPLGSVTSKIGSGATPPGGEDAYKDEGVALIRSLNVYDDGFRYARLARLDDAQAARLSNVDVQSRDVLLNITGASVARCCLVPDDVLPARVNQHVSIIRPDSSRLTPEFLHYQLIAKPNKDRLLGIGSEGGSTRQAITKAQIQAFTVVFPKAVEDQLSIALALDEMRSRTEALAEVYAAKLSALDELKKSLLHQAFSGTL